MKHVKLFENFVNEEVGDYSSEESAIASKIAEHLEKITDGETGGVYVEDTAKNKLNSSILGGKVPFRIQMGKELFKGEIVITIDWKNDTLDEEWKNIILQKNHSKRGKRSGEKFNF